MKLFPGWAWRPINGCIGLLLLLLGVVYVSVHAGAVNRCVVGSQIGPVYQVVVFSDGALSAEQKANYALLEENSYSRKQIANYFVSHVDVTTQSSLESQKVLPALPSAELPLLAVYYPTETPYRQALWTRSFDDRAIKVLLDSSARHEVTTRLSSQDVGVWVMLDGRSNRVNQKVEDLLESTLGELDDNSSLSALQLEQRRHFSMLRVAPDDPDEALLVAMLMHSREDLFDFADNPMLFLIAGHARCLYALGGAEISARNIDAVCRTVAKFSSSDVANRQRGVDLLCRAAWDRSRDHRLQAEMATVVASKKDCPVPPLAVELPVLIPRVAMRLFLVAVGIGLLVVNWATIGRGFGIKRLLGMRMKD